MPRPPALLLVALLALLGLSGCATLSEGECRTADWRQLGRQDGAQGQPRARLFEHRKACAEYGIAPDAEAYFTGRQRGLFDYCTPANGFRQGRRGARYQGVCPALLEPDFLERYRQGRALHEAEAALAGTEREIERAERRLFDEDTDAEQRRRLHRELRRLYRDYRLRQQELLRLERRLGEATRVSP
ncbi:DUF2799 domain-containing protein [Halomonas beimenensis]|uniref:ATPase involved in DNA repair n=1 Tax=Halomonas beimenensis TaxID=475662 RepID=A0A291P373_9GAMM|nr:DUF2799 domain-containing protein [Halomonas beimenensis]ATJ81331.1 hypothetical protein BEI_0344 [Halomonas beimenensis]